MQAFCCEVVRALMKLGIAIAAKRPMMATTIMISTNVKPDWRDGLIFILFFSSVSRCERCNRRVSIITILFTYCLLQPRAYPLTRLLGATTPPNTESFPGVPPDGFRKNADQNKRLGERTDF